MTCKVIRIGVFFDGTGNNLYNDEAGRSENGLSNIAKLYRLYPKEMFRSNELTECVIYTQPIYIEGIGTTPHQDDDIKGLATGAGGAKRIRLAVDKVRQLRARFPKSEYKCYIDVFGFSRGAALARDFINTMYRNELSDRIDFSFKFVGLFDTVGSFGLAGNDINYKPKTDKYTEGRTVFYELADATPPESEFEKYNFHLTPQSAERIVHFVALDEYRKHFPLSSIEGAGDTYAFIGAHSDVGGGYAETTTEKLCIYKLTYSLESARAIIENPENGIKIGENWHYRDEPPEFAKVLNGKRWIECRGKRTVSDDLQRIPFVAMYNLAVQAGVPLLPFTEAVNEGHIRQLQESVAGTKYVAKAERYFNDVSWTPELKDYCTIAISSPATLESFLGARCLYNDEQGQPYRSESYLKILAKYAHNSSVESAKENLGNPPPIGFMPRLDNAGTRVSNRLRRAKTNKNIPAREVYHNDINKAIVFIGEDSH